MTGKDDGGFSPHPGDPWHPQWRSDDEASDVEEAAASTGDGDPAEPARGRRRLFGRRSRRDPADAVADFEDLLGDDADFDQEPLGPLAPTPQDPFTDVLEAEGRGVRRQPPATDELPAWSVESETDGADSPLDSRAETDPASAPGEAIGGDVDSPPSFEVAQPDLFTTDDAPEGDDPGASVEPDVASPIEPAAAVEAEVVGAYGVAGPEAFDALADTAEEDLDDWDRFMQGEGDVPPVVGTPDEPVGDLAAFDEWVDEADEAPVAKRRWFSRRSGGGEDADIEDTGEPQAWDETVEYGALGTNAEETWEAGFAASSERETPPAAQPAEFDAPDAEDPDHLVGSDAFAAADDEVPDAAAPQVMEPQEWPAADGGGGEVEAVVEPSVEAPAAEVADPAAMLDAGFDGADQQPVEEAPSSDEAVAEVADWEGDPGRVPSSWFAEIDEDTEVPPPVADTPETEWPDDEGRWEGRTAWSSSEEPAEVFDVEVAAAPSDEAPSFSLDDGPVVPEGYQPWSEAVEDAVAGSDDTAEYQVHPMPIPDDGIPEGFERFPPTGVGPDGFDDPAPYATDEDEAVLDEVELDERIYTAGGTVEHRGLAEAIAAAGDDEDFEWQAISAAMPGVSTGVVGFEDVADLAHDEEYVAPVRSNLAIRALTGIALIGLLGASLVLGDWAFSLFVGLVVMLGLGEFYMTLSRRGFLPLTVFGLAGGLGILVATWFHGPVAIPAGVMLTTIVVFFFYAFAPTRHDALADGGLTILGVGWAVGGVAFAIPIAQAVDFQILILVVVGATAAMDIGAFETGRRWGRRPLAPVLSPKKTIEGLLGGAFLTLAVAAAIGYLEVGPFDLASALALGAIVVVTAPLGDLGESMIKRGIGVKDMGSTLPGHGGVFDRIDALVFVVPAAWVLFETIGFLG